jgi:hypothetical protein
MSKAGVVMKSQWQPGERAVTDPVEEAEQAPPADDHPLGSPVEPEVNIM